jgi:hypothetical protein
VETNLQSGLDPGAIKGIPAHLVQAREFGQPREPAPRGDPGLVQRGGRPGRLRHGLRHRPADPDGPRLPLIRSSAWLMSAEATIPASRPSANTRARPSEHPLSRGNKSATGSSGVARTTERTVGSRPSGPVSASSDTALRGTSMARIAQRVGGPYPRRGNAFGKVTHLA